MKMYLVLIRNFSLKIHSPVIGTDLFKALIYEQLTDTAASVLMGSVVLSKEVPTHEGEVDWRDG